MRVVDILEAQERLEELIDELAPGDWFAIAIGGEPRQLRWLHSPRRRIEN